MEEIGLREEQVLKNMNDEENNVNTATPSWVPQEHPLLIELILEIILSNPNLSLQDLISCRLVCRNWNRVSLPKVKPKTPEVIFSVNDTHKTNRFLSTMQNVGIPFGKFQLQFDPTNPDLSAFQELIDLCPNEIRSLHLAPVRRLGYDFHATPGPDTNKATFQNWLKTLKNLVTLTITEFEFGVTSSSSFFEPGDNINLDHLREFHFLQVGTREKLSSGFLNDFFIAAQNLDKLSFGVKNYCQEYEEFHPRPDDYEYGSYDAIERYEKEHGQMLRLMLDKEEEANTIELDVLFKSLLNHGNLDNIKVLTLHNLSELYKHTTLLQIGKKGLKLESLQVQGTIGWCPVWLGKFLETQKDSLKTLDISGGSQSPFGLHLWFPSEMKELRSLTLSNNALLLIPAICYKTRFPKIRTFHVESGHRRWRYREDVLWIQNMFFSQRENLVGCDTLKELRMIFTLWGDQGQIKEIIQRVSAIFPAIVIRVQVDRVDDDGKGQASDFTLKIFGN